jgi:prolyl-tRNA synthetase
MKDAYSFHSDTKSLSEYYEVMYKVYSEIFKRCGLKFRAVLADSGAIGGDDTHEFMVLAESGESRVLSCSSESCGYAATDETAESVISEHKFSETLSELELVETPDTRTIEEVAAFFRTDSRNIIKTIIYQGDNKFYAVLIRGDRDVNEIKLKKVLSVTELHIAHPEDVERLTGSETGYAGPVNMNSEISILADSSVEKMTNFIIGANKKGYHYKNANINRDFKINNYYDLRLADKGDKCVRCGSELDEYRGIEVGQIFKLGTKYSEKMNAVYTDENGNSLPFVMGCYGIGVTRIIASAIEQNNDDKGIIWPVSISPFEAVVVAFGKKGTDEYDAAEKIYKNLVDAGIDAAFDNRDLRPGVKFKDADLIGYPLQIIAGKKSLSENKVEISIRKSSEKIFADIDKITETVNSLLKEL